MNIIFFGSDDFAQAHLKTMIDDGCPIVACVTQPDRPKGRGMAVAVSPVKETALEHNIPILQPKDIKDALFVKELEAYKADLFVVIAYGKFLTQELLDMPSLGAINVHGSLLPKYRGAAPINWAILQGEKETGVTVMFLDKRMDAGAIIEQATLKIDKGDTAVSLRLKMIDLGKKTLCKVLKDFKGGPVSSVAQDEKKVTLAPKLTKELGVVEWADSAKDIERKIRGLQPWPGVYTFLNEKMLKILKAETVSGKGQPGELVAMGDETMDIATGKGVLRIYEVHLANSKPMSATAFLRGQRIDIGTIFPYNSA